MTDVPDSIRIDAYLDNKWFEMALEQSLLHNIVHLTKVRKLTPTTIRVMRQESVYLAKTSEMTGRSLWAAIYPSDDKMQRLLRLVGFQFNHTGTNSIGEEMLVYQFRS